MINMGEKGQQLSGNFPLNSMMDEKFLSTKFSGRSSSLGESYLGVCKREFPGNIHLIG